MTGIAPSTNSESRGLVTTIMAAPPRNSTRLRKAIDTEAPTADLIWVVSAVRRETISPARVASKNADDRRVRCVNTSERRSATMRSPKCRHKIVTHRARYREHRHDEDHHREITVDQLHRLIGESEIDHPPDGHGHDQGGECGDDQRGQRGERAAADIATMYGTSRASGLSLTLRRSPGAGAPTTSRPRPSLENSCDALCYRPGACPINALRA